MAPAARRWAPRLFGHTASMAPATHVGNGGFSSRSWPFMVGTSQLPSLTISRAVTTLRSSMISVGSAPVLAKNVTRVKITRMASVVE